MDPTCPERFRKKIPDAMTKLADPLELPCGAVIHNRILKSAMSEVLGTSTHAPSPELSVLYGRWARGGLGVAVTGNVMIHPDALGEPGNVVVEDERDLAELRAWASAGTANDTHLWMQLNHPGKQAPGFLNDENVAPSAIGFEKLPGFPVPRPLEEAEIEDLIARFGRAAGVAKKAGFTGVQIHGAHGYLVSQFLSPHHNQRTDRWGGSLENRARFVMQVYGSIREAVGPDFPVSIKMNSADFQRGGFDEGDSIQVMQQLAGAGIDLIEVSGGTYESPAMTGARMKASTKAREGYFLEFVQQAREQVDVPLCVTGGFRTPEGMQGALDEGASMVGLARTLCIQPAFARRVIAGEQVTSLVKRIRTGVKTVDTLGAFDVTWYETQLARMAHGKEPDPDLSPWRSLGSTLLRGGLQHFRQRRAR